VDRRLDWIKSGSKMAGESRVDEHLEFYGSRVDSRWLDLVVEKRDLVKKCLRYMCACSCVNRKY
jgi:hypothetical protein